MDYEQREYWCCQFSSDFNLEHSSFCDNVCLHLVSPEATGGCLRSTCGLLASGTQTSELKGKTTFLNLYIGKQMTGSTNLFFPMCRLSMVSSEYVHLRLNNFENENLRVFLHYGYIHLGYLLPSR